MKINVRPLPETTQPYWLDNLSKAKDAAGATTSLAPTPSKPMDTLSTLSPTSPITPVKLTEHTKYCAICRYAKKEFPMSLDWENDQNKEDHKDSEKKTPQTRLKYFVTTSLTPQPPIPSIEQSSREVQCNP